MHVDTGHGSLLETHTMPFVPIVLLLPGQTTLRSPSLRSSWYPSLSQTWDALLGDGCPPGSQAGIDRHPLLRIPPKKKMPSKADPVQFLDWGPQKLKKNPRIQGSQTCLLAPSTWYVLYVPVTPILEVDLGSKGCSEGCVQSPVLHCSANANLLLPLSSYLSLRSC